MAVAVEMETLNSELLFWCHQCDAEIIAAEASTPGREAQEQAQGRGAGGGEGDSRLRGLICPECGDGFIEAMETARSLRHVRRVMRRREVRRQPRETYGGGSGNSNGNSSSNGNDVSSQEVLRVIRFLVRSSRDSNLALDSDQVRDSISDTGGEILSNDMAAVSLDSDQTLGVISETGREIPSHARTLDSETRDGLCDCGEIPTHEILDETSRPLNSIEARVGLSETNHEISESDDGISDCNICGLGEINAESTRSLASESRDGISEAREVISESYDRVSQSCDGISNPGEIELREIVGESARLSNPEPQDESSGSQNGMERYGEEHEHQHGGEVADVEETESDEEDGHLELNDWDSFEEEEEEDEDDEDEDEDEDEWEEVEFSESDLVVRFLEAVDGMQGEVARDRGHIEEEETRMVEGGEGGSRVHRNNSLRFGNVLRRGLFRRLQAIRRNYNTEIDLDWFESDAYVGNPGDYVDARGFEEVLQQLMETDNSRRGAPPASKSAIEALPLVHIKQQNLDDGSAICAICKDVVAFDELAKQLPCLHLYHSTCILPWLSARNSCPVCRYELPTDDPDYEEEKKKRSNPQQAMQENRSLNTSEEPSGDRPGPERNSNDEPSQAEAMEIHSESFEEEIEIGNDLNSLSNVVNENEEEIESGSELNALENTAKVKVEEIECGSVLNALGNTANVKVEEIECVNESNESVNYANFKEVVEPGTHSNAFNNGIESRDELDALRNVSNQGEIECVSELNASVNNGNKEEIECRNELSIHGNNANAKRKPSLIEMIAGPLFSVVGLIIVSCLGNFFLGNGLPKQPRFDWDAKPRRMEEVQKYKPWWVRLFG